MTPADVIPERGRPVRLLMVEDVAEDAELTVLALREAGYLVEHDVVADRAAFLERLGTRKYDLVVADYGLPGWTGLDAVRELRASGSDLPVIIVTGSLGDETAVECLKQGACDYVLKHRLVKLPFAVQRALRTYQLQVERAAAEWEREQLLHAMRQRVKELTCISEMMRCLARPGSLPEMLQAAVALIPSGLQYAEIAGARLQYDGHVYAAGAPAGAGCGMSSPLRVSDARAGHLEVFYAEARPAAAEGPFLSEERTLLDTLAGAISEALERRATHEALRKREAQFRSLIEHGHDLIGLIGGDGSVLYLTPSVRRILGYEPEELMGKNAFGWVMADDAEHCRTLLEDALRYPGKIYQFDMRIRHKDGSARTLEVIGSNLLDDPDVAAIVLNQRDVTDRCLVEEELRRSERKYRELFDLANDAILIFDPEQEIILEANAGACELYGIPHARLVGMSLKRLTRDVERGERQIAELLRAGSWTNFESRHQRVDGTVIDVLANSKVIEYAGRTAILSVNHDITELKHAQNALRQAHDDLERRVEERTAELAQVNAELRRARDEWQSTFDCMSDAITVQDASFHILRWNRAFAGLFPGAEIAGRKCHQLVHGTEVPPDHCPMACSLKTGESGICEFFEPNLGRYVCARTDLLRGAGGKLEHIVHSITDISERKEIERMKNDFVSCVSHELRTPLASLRGFAELMLQRDYPAEKRRHFLEIIHKESRRLGDLVNDVLDLQRIEAGRAVLRFEPVSLPEVVRETAELFSTPGQEHQVIDEVSPGLPPVLADVEAVRQILRNLVSNAVKYSPRGGEIRIGAREEAGQALVWVSDQGIGIAPELLPHIFSKFYRAPETAARRIGGTGLGLAVVKGLVEAHQGTVRVESLPGQGSIFYFTLPLAQPVRGTEAA